MGVNQRAQIVLTDDEVARLVDNARTMTLATVGPTGHPHLVAMWYGVVDGTICFESKAKSQKVQNLRRNPRVSCLIEDGMVYEELRGVAFEGTGEIVEDADLLWRIGISVFERYYGPYTDNLEPFVTQMLAKRVGIRVHADRVRSWDHSKLGLPALGPPSGSTAAAERRPR